MALACGITKKVSPSENSAIRAAVARNGTIIRWKLTPQDRIAMISEFAAMREVKKITVMKTNSEANMFTRYGM